MPELPEVETIKTAVAKGIGCCRIEQVVVRNPNLRQKVPADLPQKVENAMIINFRRIAKYIVIDLDNGLSLLWHMGMSGKISLCDKRPTTLQKHDHIIIKTTNGFIIYNDPRRFGLFTYCQTDNIKNIKLFAKTGVDPFGDSLTTDYLFGRLQQKKKLPIKEALLDQSIIAGIGNIYASEILYESRISPLRLCSEISKEECKKIIANTRDILQKAIKAGGSTLRDYKKPDGSLGYFQNQHCVYNKTGQPCPDCICNIAKTGGIKKIVQGGRSTFYCESLQK